MHLYLLGRPSVSDDRGATIDVGGPALTLLAYLALQPRTSQRADLASLFYPRADQRRGRANVSKLLWELRQVLDEDYFERTYRTLALDRRQGIAVDAQEFATALRRVEREWGAASQASDAPADRLYQVLALYRGSFMKDAFLTDSPALQEWHLFEQEHNRRLFLEGSARLVQFRLAQRQWPEAAAALTYALRLEPLDEALRMLELQVLAAQGQQDQVQATGQRYRRRLQAELDLAPSAEYETLLARLTTNPSPRGGGGCQRCAVNHRRSSLHLSP